MPETLISGQTFFLLLDEPIKPLTVDTTVVAFTSSQDAHACYKNLLQEFRSLQHMKDRVYDLTSLVSKGAGLKRITNEIASIFKMPCSIVDNSLSFLSYSDNFPDYAAKNEQKQSGFLPEEAQQYLLEVGLIRPRKVEDLLKVFTWVGDNGNTLINHFVFICIENTPIASFSLLSNSVSLRKSRTTLLLIIAQLLSIELQKGNTYLLNKSMYYSHLFEKLMNGEISDEVDSLKKRFSLFGYNLGEYKFLLFVDLSEVYFDISQAQSLAERIRQSINNSIYVIDERSVIFLSSGEEIIEDIDIGTDTLQDLVKGTVLKIGISSIFRNTLRINTYLSQAKQAIKTGLHLDPEKQVFSFSEYRLADLLTKLEDKQLLYSYLYPPLMRVIDLDSEHKTKLALTLYTYLEDPANPNAVCKKLFIHKNTLYYRLEKIRSIMGTDFKDAETIMKIQFSFLILKYQRRFEELVKYPERIP